MDYYTLRSHSASQDFVTVTQETNDGFMIRIVRDLDGFQEIKNEYITKDLFESCLRTGYLTKITGGAKKMAAIA